MAEIDKSPAWLEDVEGNQIPLGTSFSVGRSSSNQLPLVSGKVSRRHAMISSNERGEYWLVDLGSRNGTYVNQRRVVRPVQLLDGDQVDLGEFTYVFRFADCAGSVGSNDTIADKTIAEIKPCECWLMLADIISSTELSVFYAADELPRITGEWLEKCQRIIEENHGVVNKFLGDGFFAYWQDSDEAAAQVLAATNAFKPLQEAGEPAFRVVLHKGRVFAGGGGSMGEESLSGKEVNFIFRAEKKAGELKLARMMSESARSGFQDRVTSEEVGRHPLSGFEGEFLFHSF